MVIYLGADHRGFHLKEAIKKALIEEGKEVVDCGNTIEDTNDDYVDYARAVAERVSREPETSRGIVMCGSGAGVDITANKFAKVRSLLGFANDQVLAARRDDDVNVLALAADYIKEAQAKELTKTFLDTAFDTTTERYQKRIEKIHQIENG